jgi:hypothetical protein
MPPAAPPAGARKAADGEFCEIGVSAVTVQRTVDGTPELFCSKRSSAALRSAIAAETCARNRRVDEDAMMVEPEAGDEAGGGAGGGAGPSSDAMAAMAHEGSVASRMRRDCKRALEQRRRATLCGETPLLRIRLVGRAVRIYGAWYSICSFCATFVRVQPHNRIDAEIACLQCCETFRRERCAPADAGANRPMCRFCKKVESGRLHNYTTYHSPRDVSGPNLERPPPLRTTAWCPTHNRLWLRDALSALSTPQILAHIAVHARPVAQTPVAGASVGEEGAPAGRARPGRNIATMKRRASELTLRRARKAQREAQREAA